MTELELSGVVEAFIQGTFDDAPCSSVTIGGKDVLTEINATFPGHRVVTVAVADERFEGDLMLDFGSPGYSEYTPGSVAELTVGPHDILEILERLEGQTVTLWIADEPVDLARRNAEAEAKRAQAFADETEQYRRQMSREAEYINDNLAEITRLTEANEARAANLHHLLDVITRRENGEDAKP